MRTLPVLIIFLLFVTTLFAQKGKVTSAFGNKEAGKLDKAIAAYEKVLTQIPDWTPAMRGDEDVSVYYDMMFMNKARNDKKATELK